MNNTKCAKIAFRLNSQIAKYILLKKRHNYILVGKHQRKITGENY